MGELSRLLPEASKKVLMAELKRLVLAGIVLRRDLTGDKTVRHVEYCLAKPIEEATIRLLQQLDEWNRAAQAVVDSSASERSQHQTIAKPVVRSVFAVPSPSECY